MAGWTYYLVIVVLIVMLPYALIPLLVLSRQRINSQPSFSTREESELPGATQEYFRQISPALLAQGFEARQDLQIEHFAPGQVWHLRLFTHAEESNLAIAVDLHQRISATQGVNMRFVEFNCRFGNGQEFSLSNSDLLRQPGMCPHKHMISIPYETDLERLYTLFRQLKWVYGHGDSGQLPATASAQDVIRDSIARDVRCSLEQGYLTPSGEATYYRPTLKGAYLSTWMQMWPLSRLRKARVRRLARRLLAAAQQSDA